jgi:hypothetical protein
MFVGTPIGPWHQHAVLPQRRYPDLSLTNDVLVFPVTCTRLRRRPSPARDFDDLERIWQALANHINLVSAFDATARCGTLTVNLYVPAGHGRGRQASRSEETAIEQPAIDAQGISR